LITEIKAILLDIEGTTTPIDFVHKTLFPYSRERMAAFVRANFEELNAEVRRLKTEYESDGVYPSAFDENSPESVAEYLRFLIDGDRKSTPLKSIQGMIWQDGYASGEIQSEVFGDVPPAFERWSASGNQIAIYSSGSILAQRDLFKHTKHGDLTPFISAYFDTITGGKRETESYAIIAIELEIAPGRILFVSDITAELDAAQAAGMQTTLSVREGNASVSEEHSHREIRSFDEIDEAVQI
jgi:enolase-phosphatase E1